MGHVVSLAGQGEELVELLPEELNQGAGCLEREIHDKI